ncbi:MAG: hypothetical protein LBT29_06095, partial [Flavobacteriaceae bacterium]|nr:hypothetical protein [Flavobacteriaceae bacterium]
MRTSIFFIIVFSIPLGIWGYPQGQVNAAWKDSDSLSKTSEKIAVSETPVSLSGNDMSAPNSYIYDIN